MADFPNSVPSGESDNHGNETSLLPVAVAIATLAQYRYGVLEISFLNPLNHINPMSLLKQVVEQVAHPGPNP